MILFKSKHRLATKTPIVSLLFSKNPNTQLVDKLKPKIASDFNEVAVGNELIFDAEGISFKSIIEYMQVFKEQQCVFKIQPKTCSYIIGSSSAHTKGEVIQF